MSKQPSSADVIILPDYGSIPLTPAAFTEVFQSERALRRALESELTAAAEALSHQRADAAKASAAEAQLVSFLRDELATRGTETMEARLALRQAEQQVEKLTAELTHVKNETVVGLQGRVHELEQQVDALRVQAAGAVEAAAGAERAARATVAERERSLEAERARIRRDLVAARTALRRDATLQLDAAVEAARAAVEAEAGEAGQRVRASVVALDSELQSAAELVHRLQEELAAERHRSERLEQRLAEASGGGGDTARKLAREQEEHARTKDLLKTTQSECDILHQKVVAAETMAAAAAVAAERTERNAKRLIRIAGYFSDTQLTETSPPAAAASPAPAPAPAPAQVSAPAPAPVPRHTAPSPVAPPAASLRVQRRREVASVLDHGVLPAPVLPAVGRGEKSLTRAARSRCEDAPRTDGGVLVRL